LPPVSRNAVVAVSLILPWAWSDFFFANTLDGGGRRPITLGIYK
jgi:multiple sugar transport system permease protein